jgi:hypothetical protein
VNRRVVLLNLALLALAGWLFWVLRSKWVELHIHEHTVLASSTQARVKQNPPAVPLFKPMVAAEYNDTVQHDVFARDRNPNVIVDPPPPAPLPPPPPPMPELPAYYGIMNFGDPVVLLRLPKESQKNYHAGEKVGPFQLVSFDPKKIVFDWNGKIVERDPEDLREKESVQEVVVAKAAQPVAAPATTGATARSLGGDSDKPKLAEVIGKDNGGGIRQCVAGDKTPVGTIVDGYKKVVTTNMFGETCMWQQVNP